VLSTDAPPRNFVDHSPLLLFGLVRHVVRTQSPYGPPDPDVEGWLAAGRPGHDRDLARAWDLLNLCRHGRDPVGAPPRQEPAEATIERLDAILLSWPGGISNFGTTYGRIEHRIEASGTILPPLGL
jgi:hypothetical protein